MAKKKYSAKERKAFHMGRAWSAGKAGKRVNCPDEQTKKSFRNGVKAQREGKSSGKPRAQAQPLNGTYSTPPHVKVDNVYYQQLNDGSSALVDKGTGTIICTLDTGKVVR